jgi:superfamily II DNA or RNA helicase
LRDAAGRALTQDQLRWIDLESGIRTPDAAEHAGRQLRTARGLLARLYGPKWVPGVILGDEVGMGKTYEALAVIAALFRHVPLARVLVLTHSQAMADTWAERWNWFREHAVAKKHQRHFHEGDSLYDIADLGRGRLGFASYDRLKRMPMHELRCALERAFEGRYLRGPARRRLAWELLGSRIAPTDGQLAAKIARGALNRLWRTYFDPETGTWRQPWSAWSELRKLIYRASRTTRRVDLLIVDEAHKVASHQRMMFFEEVLGSRAARAIYVTATPFSLSVEQLYDRIEDMHVVTGHTTDALAALWKDLERFRDIVLSRGDLPRMLRTSLEQRLRRYLVRSLWKTDIAEGVPRRKSAQVPVPNSLQDQERAHAMLGLETALVRVAGIGARTHSTAHRETLCSSYAAIRDAAKRSRSRRTAFAPELHRLMAILPSKGEQPKFEAVASYLSKLARSREKVVVFCGRIATVTALRRALNHDLRSEIDAERQRWTRVQERLRRAQRIGTSLVDRDNAPKLRLAVHRFGDIPPGSEASAVRRIVRKLRESGEPGEEASRADLWDQSWGPRRRIEWVGVLAGQHGGDESRRSPQAVQFGFNLPGPPYVLLCTEIAREGIDLHLWCRRVVQYDLDWNPALMEQQIGRVDRIGSLSRRILRPLEVLWAWVPGTYEQYMAKKVDERMKMMKVLLGAGEWLAASPEEQATISELERYRLDFAP